MQELIGNMTVEQFTQFLGSITAYLLFVLGSGVLAIAFGSAIIDGWLFRKGALYYGSLRYLNKCFKKLRNCNSLQELDFSAYECLSAIYLLRFQRTIPKIIYKRLLDKCNEIHLQRRSELWQDEYIYST